MRTIALAIIVSALTAPAAAQWLNHPTPGIPRTADGKPNLAVPLPRTPGGTPDLSGLWETVTTNYRSNITTGLKPEEIQPWARALVKERNEDFEKGHMSVQCLPYGPASVTSANISHRFMKVVQTPAVIIFLLGDLTYRQIFMDGRALEADPNPSWMGYSVGRWEGDTLVVESNGYNDRTWLDLSGHPHTEALRTTERYRRRDGSHMDIEMTLHDPAVYARPWTVSLKAVLAADTELLEFVCNENPGRLDHWVGKVSDERRAKVAVAPEVLATYVGTYIEQPPFAPGRSSSRTIEITLSGDALFASMDGAGRRQLLAQSESVFSGLNAPIEFVKDGAAPTAILEKHAGNDLVFQRTR